MTRNDTLTTETLLEHVGRHSKLGYAVFLSNARSNWDVKRQRFIGISGMARTHGVSLPTMRKWLNLIKPKMEKS